MYMPAGGAIRRYEETHLPRFRSEDDNEESLRHPWCVWRLSEDRSPVAMFVQRLKDDEFLCLLTARNVIGVHGDVTTRNGHWMPKLPLTLPTATDRDLNDLEGVVSIEVKTERSDWQQILMDNFVRGSSGNPSDISELDWRHILYLAWCAASVEASATAPRDDPYAVRFQQVMDRLDSISASQIPLIDQYERLERCIELVVDQMKCNPPEMRAVEDSLKTELTCQVWDVLSEDAQTKALAAERTLQDPDCPDPGLGIAGFGFAFETQLKTGILDDLCEFLRRRGLRNFPDSELLKNGSRRPRILIGGRQKDRLNLGEIALALESPRTELQEFCDTRGIDLHRLRKAIEVVKPYRNRAVHGGPISLDTAHRVRAKLLGVATSDGGVFGAFV